MSEPVTIEEGKFSVPFVEFNYIIEDRRPDLNHNEAKDQVGYKYKTSISFRFFKYYRSFIIRSLDFPYIWHKET